MLQWMGGSRRKVSTSMKSTQKRQKQYFEQRKRQQQAAGLDSYTDHKEHRSLDVLNLLNLSTTTEEHMCVSPSGTEDLNVNAFTMKYPITKGSPKIFTNTATFADFVELEAGTPSGYQPEAKSPNNVSFTAPNNQNKSLDGSSCKPYSPHSTTDQQMSIFDLLADDGPSDNLEGSPIRESHVAFSIEGLGRVGTHTPIHSPQQPGRVLQYGCSSLWKAARRPNSSKNFDHVLNDLELDLMMQDMNMPLSGSYLEFSSGTINSHSIKKQKYSTVNDCAPFDGYGSKLENSFGDSEDFYGTGNNNEHLWDARSSFLDDNFLNEKEFNASRRNWRGQMEGLDFLNNVNEISDYDFDCPHLHKNRVFVKAADGYNILDSPYPKQQMSEYNGDFITSMMTRYPEAGRSSDFRELTSQRDQSCYEDARDNLSLLSEESCTSTAVRAEATNKSSPNSTARGSTRPKNSFGSHGNRQVLKNKYAKETQHKNRFDFQQGSYTCGSGKCTRMPGPSNSKQLPNLNPILQEKFGQRENLFFGEGYTSAVAIQDFSSVSQTLEVSHMGVKSSFDGSKHCKSVKYSSLGDTACEMFPFCEPLIRMSCHDLPTLQNLEFVTTKPSFSLGSEPVAPFRAARSHRETVFPDLSVQESVSKDEGNKSETHPPNCKKFEPGQQSCNCNNCLFSKKKETVNASDFGGNIIECKEAKDETSEQTGSPKTPPDPEHVEEASSSMKNPNKFEHIEDKDPNGGIPPSCQNKIEGKDDAGAERKIVSQRQGNCVDSFSPVMMLESYVLQLLCVQQVMKDSSEQNPMKEL